MSDSPMGVRDCDRAVYLNAPCLNERTYGEKIGYGPEGTSNQRKRSGSYPP